VRLTAVTNTLAATVDEKAGEIEFTTAGNYMCDYVSDANCLTPAPGSQLNASLQLEQWDLTTGLWTAIESAQWITAAITSDPQVVTMALKAFARFRKGDKLRITARNGWPGNDVFLSAGRFLTTLVTG
jgi:hypothetical protein